MKNSWTEHLAPAGKNRGNEIVYKNEKLENVSILNVISNWI